LTSRRPTFRWELGGKTDGASIDVCADRACTRVLTSLSASGDTASPSADLPTGIVFWHLHGKAGNAVGTTTSVVWEMSVPAQSRPITSTWGTLVDGDGDGRSDIVIGDSDLYSPTQHVYVYPGASADLGSAVPSVLSAATPTVHYATSIAGAGDVNGDGFPELLVGSPGEDKVYVYAGGPSGFAEPPATVLFGPSQSGYGTSVSSAGDVNGDGYGDIVVGAPTMNASDVSTGLGGALVYLGGPSGVSASSIMPLPPTVASDTEGLGQFVAAAGDMNGDGLGDVAVYGGVSPTDPQVLVLYMGNRTSFGQQVGLTLQYEGASPTWLGIANLLTGAGDLNGDGYPDLAMASVSPPNSFYQTDHITLFYGGPDGPPRIPNARLDSTITSTDHFATSLTAADFDGTGTTDLGAAIVSNAALGPVAQVYQGQAPEPALATTLTTSDPTRLFLREVGALDIDGDGTWDLVVGFPGRQTPVDAGMLNGAVQIYKGGPQGVSSSAFATLLPPDTTAVSFGASLVRP
jgi:hypothetical protein